MNWKFPMRFRQNWALLKYVLECASDAGCCMKPVKMMADSQNTMRFLFAHTCAFRGVGILFAYKIYKARLFRPCWIHFTMNGCARAVG